MHKKHLTATMSVLFSLFLIGVCTFGITACGSDDDKYEKLVPPDTKPKRYYAVNGKQVLIKSAAYYYDSDRDGYNFVFSDEEEALEKLELERPKGNYFTFDFPGMLVNKLTDIAADNIHTEDWKTILTTNKDNQQIFSHLKSGRLSINFSGNYFVINVNAVDEDNVTWQLVYEGQPEQALHYIFGY